MGFCLVVLSSGFCSFVVVPRGFRVHPRLPDASLERRVTQGSKIVVWVKYYRPAAPQVGIFGGEYGDGCLASDSIASPRPLFYGCRISAPAAGS